MASRRRGQRELSVELEYHIRSNWAHFRRQSSSPAVTVLDKPVYRFTEGPFCGKPVASVPVWYINYLCCGGENFLLWKDKALSLALSRLKYEKVECPEAPVLPPLLGFPSASRSSNPQYASLAIAARDAPDGSFLLKSKDIRKANAQGPGLHIQSETDRSRAYDAHMKNKLFGFRNGTNRTYDEKSW